MHCPLLPEYRKRSFLRHQLCAEIFHACARKRGADKIQTGRRVVVLQRRRKEKNTTKVYCRGFD